MNFSIGYGEGHYAISAGKNISVTEDFLSLDERTRRCQSTESIMACSNKKYKDLLKSDCGCIPFELYKVIKMETKES